MNQLTLFHNLNNVISYSSVTKYQQFKNNLQNTESNDYNYWSHGDIPYSHCLLNSSKKSSMYKMTFKTCLLDGWSVRKGQFRLLCNLQVKHLRQVTIVLQLLIIADEEVHLKRKNISIKLATHGYSFPGEFQRRNQIQLFFQATGLALVEEQIKRIITACLSNAHNCELTALS